MTIALMLAFSDSSYAASAPSATCKVNASDGAWLRSSSSVSSDKVKLLKDNAKLTITKEIFKSKTSTAKKNRWYYVSDGSDKGYIRADLVDTVKYSSVSGKTNDALNYRKGAGTAMAKKGTLKSGKSVTVYLKAKPVKSVNGGTNTWYRIKVGSSYYYASSAGIDLIDDSSSDNKSDKSGDNTAADKTSDKDNDGKVSMTTEKTGATTAKTTKKKFEDMTAAEFDRYLTQQGFTGAYKTKLKKLHKAHPNWEFVGLKTGISWKTALSKESANGVSLIHSSLPKSYRAKDKKSYIAGVYIPKDGLSWFNANKKVVAYYMDPRNFLDENRIYMFEDLSYQKEYQTKKVVNKILSPTVLPDKGFGAKMFVNAGAKHDISPVHLASRARQETGGGSIAVNGYKINGKKVYNPFNIGASSGFNPVMKGLRYAYNKGWTTQKKSVNGAASFLASGYIVKKQNSIYFQRFNVANGSKKLATHQYMTNIQAPYHESYSTGQSYRSYKITKEPIKFIIPIYKNMPSKTSLPK